MDSDMRWLWAAYQLGMWRDIMAGNLSQDGFEEKALEIIAGAPYEWIVEAQGDDGLRPVCVFMAQTMGANGIEPAVQWLPWATPRNRVEAIAVFLKEISKQMKIFVFSCDDNVRFWTRMASYGLVRRGCKVVDYFSRGNHAMLFYTVGQ